MNINEEFERHVKFALALSPITPPKGESWPDSKEYWMKRAMLDQSLILEQKTEIGKLKTKINDLEQKLKPVPRETKTDRKPETADMQKVYLTKKKRKLTGLQLEWFNDFWKLFDYKAGKAEAADTWLDLKVDANTYAEIIEGAEREAQARPGMLQAGRTPKMAQGWLSGRRWEDEPLEIPVRPSKPLDPSAYIVPDDWKKRGFAVDIKQREGETYTQFRERVLQAGG